jgi:hypothetical protein
VTGYGGGGGGHKRGAWGRPLPSPSAPPSPVNGRRVPTAEIAPNDTRSSPFSQPGQCLQAKIVKLIHGPSSTRILASLRRHRAGSRRTGRGAGSEWVRRRLHSGRCCREPWTSNPASRARRSPEEPCRSEGLEAMGRQSPKPRRGLRAPLSSWLAEGRTGHKPRSRGEASVSSTRRLPASGSKPRHAAHCGTDHSRNRTAGRFRLSHPHP